LDKALSLLNRNAGFQIKEIGVANKLLITETRDFVDHNTPPTQGKELFRERIREILK
jgi:hypothetical protein